MGIRMVRGFEQWRGLSRLDRTRPELLDAVSKRLGVAAMKLLADQFRASVDPYGDAWKPVTRNRKRDKRGRRKNGRADKPLIDSGRLRGAVAGRDGDISARSGGGRVRIDIPVEYAPFHQTGTKHIARRQILPDRARGLPATWESAFRKEVAKTLRDWVKGRLR